MRASFRASTLASSPEPRRSTSSPSRVAVTTMSSGLASPLRSRLSRGQRAAHLRAEQRAAVDGDDLMRTGAHEANLVGPGMGEAGVEGRPAPARAMRIDQLADLRPDAGALQRFDHQAALPRAVEFLRHVLRRAAAATAVPGADRLGSLGRSRQRLDKLGLSAHEPDHGALAGQGAGNDRPVRGHALALGVESDDRKLFGRLNHGERRSGIPSRPRRQGSATGSGRESPSPVLRFRPAPRRRRVRAPPRF